MTNPIMKFTQPNIDAIRNGRKMQTRRPIKPQPSGDVPDEFVEWFAWGNSWATVDSRDREAGVVDDDMISLNRDGVYRVADPDGVETDLLIKITGVRVERLQDITDADALAEGVGNQRQRESTQYEGKWIGFFRELWSTIYGPDNQFAWERNPFVFVYEFEVTK